MVTKFPKYFEKGLRERYFDNPKKTLIINGVLSGYQGKAKVIPFLGEDLEYSERRIKIKNLEISTLLEEIKKDEQEVKKITRLLKYLRK